MDTPGHITKGTVIASNFTSYDHSILPPWHALLAKEWHEQKWRAATLTIALLLFVFFASGGSNSDLVANFQFAAWLIGSAGALFIAVKCAVGERNEGSIGFLLSLPIERWKIGIAHILVSAFLCVAPLLVTALILQIILLLSGQSAQTTPLWTATVVSLGGCLALFFWITATTLDQPTELRAAALGITVIVLWAIIGVLLPPASPAYQPFGLAEVILGIGPAGWWRMNTVPVHPPDPGIVVWSLIGFSLLAALIIGNYGRPPRPSLPSIHLKWRGGVRKPYRRPGIALVVMHLRELLPIVSIGILSLVAWSAFLLHYQASEDIHLPKTLEFVTTASSAIGVFLMVATVVYTFVPSLEPNLMSFWRSRPIPPNEWFWSKYSICLLVSLTLIHTPTTLIIGTGTRIAWFDCSSEIVACLCLCLMHTAIASIAVLCASLTRRTVSAAILALSTSAIIIWMPMFAGSDQNPLRFDFAREQLRSFAQSGFQATSYHDLQFLPFLSLMAFIAVTASWIAAWAFRHDFSLQ